MKKRTGLAILALLGLGLYRYRRAFLARLWKLPAPRHGVSVQRDIPVAMPDGIRLLTDHYSPRTAGSATGKTDGDFPTILIRTPSDHLSQCGTSLSAGPSGGDGSAKLSKQWLATAYCVPDTNPRVREKVGPRRNQNERTSHCPDSLCDHGQDNQ